MSYRINQEIDDKCFWSNESISVLEWISASLGLFKDKPGKVSSSQVVNDRVKMLGFFIRWLGTIKHLSSKKESSSGIIEVKTGRGAFYQTEEREPKGWVFVIQQRSSKYQWVTTVDIYSLSFIVLQVSWSTLPSGCQLSRLAIDCRLDSGPQAPRCLILRSRSTRDISLGNDTSTSRNTCWLSKPQLRTSFCHSASHCIGLSKSMSKLKISRVETYTLHILVALQRHVAKGVAL